MINENELPKNWEVVKLGEVCKLKNGYRVRAAEYENRMVFR